MWIVFLGMLVRPFTRNVLVLLVVSIAEMSALAQTGVFTYVNAIKEQQSQIETLKKLVPRLQADQKQFASDI